MRKLIIAALILIPVLSFAKTDCRVIQYADHDEAVCVGDEKYAPAAERQPAATASRSEPAVQPAVSPAVQAVPQASVSAPSPQSVDIKPTPEPTIQRQGRQQHQQRLDAARATRNQLIDSLRQAQPTP